MSIMMKRMRINAGKVGLVFRYGDYHRVVTEGIYWIFPYESVVQYDLAKQMLYPPVALNLLLRDERLREMLILVEVLDHEIALKFENGIFAGVLLPGRYTFWKGVTDYRFQKVDLSQAQVGEDIDPVILQKRAVADYLRVFVVESYQKGVLFIDGAFERILPTGTYYFWKNSIPIRVETIDLRQQQLEVPGQEILTRDKAALRINFTAQYQVIDIEKALVDNKDYLRQLYLLMQMALREYVGTLTLDELLEKKDGIGQHVRTTLEEQTAELGVRISHCGVRDVILPGEVKDIMNRVLIAQKQAEANVIMRREETASTRSLLNTAKLMEDNEMLFKLKEMEYVEKIAERIGEITVAGNGQVLDQLKGIFTPVK